MEDAHELRTQLLVPLAIAERPSLQSMHFLRRSCWPRPRAVYKSDTPHLPMAAKVVVAIASSILSGDALSASLTIPQPQVQAEAHGRQPIGSILIGATLAQLRSVVGRCPSRTPAPPRSALRGNAAAVGKPGPALQTHAKTGIFFLFRRVSGPAVRRTSGNAARREPLA